MTTRYVDGDGPGPLPSGVWADTIGDTTLSVTARRTHSGASDQPILGECGGAEHSMDRRPIRVPRITGPEVAGTARPKTWGAGRTVRRAPSVRFSRRHAVAQALRTLGSAAAASGSSSDG
jgi:hypothetical protein